DDGWDWDETGWVGQLEYDWSVIGGAVTGSGSTAILEFSAADEYTGSLTVEDEEQATDADPLTIDIEQVAATVEVGPGVEHIYAGQMDPQNPGQPLRVQFSVTAASDQFGDAIDPQALSGVTWSVTGDGGGITSDGLYTRPSPAASWRTTTVNATVTVAVGAATDTATVWVFRPADYYTYDSGTEEWSSSNRFENCFFEFDGGTFGYALMVPDGYDPENPSGSYPLVVSVPGQPSDMRTPGTNHNQVSAASPAWELAKTHYEDCFVLAPKWANDYTIPSDYYINPQSTSNPVAWEVQPEDVEAGDAFELTLRNTFGN
ncbi:MAG: hypothetical protein GY842_19945, partial [bacterium]|nr:hypothetical protein [bacterium]